MTAARIRRRIAVLTAAISIGIIGGCSASADDSSTLNLVGFAVPKAGNNAAQEAFGGTAEGDGISWRESYGASGDQSRAVLNGLKADYVHFSATPDVTRLVDAGLIDDDWNQGANRGIVTESVVVFVVREGNPKNIESWDDLTADDIDIVTPNPGSSGAARWNILGAWQHVIAQGGTPADAEAFVGRLLSNVKAFPGSGRDATQAFQGGTGDVLISYENEAILARQNGEQIDYVVPQDTLLIENPAAVLKDAAPQAQSFLDFVLTPAGQQEYASKGFRPLRSVDGVDVGTVEGANHPSDPFPEVETLYTIEGDFGGWAAVNAKFFDENTGIITRLQATAGLS